MGNKNLTIAEKPDLAMKVVKALETSNLLNIII